MLRVLIIQTVLFSRYNRQNIITSLNFLVHCVLKLTKQL